MVSNAQRIISGTLLGIFLLIIMGLFTQSLGLFGTGFDEPEILQQAFFYVTFGLGFLIGIGLLFIVELIITKGDKTYGNSIGFSSQGETPSIGFFKNVSTLQLLLGSIIIFGIIGASIFIAFPDQRSFTGIRVLPQQFTPTSSIMFSGALIPASENLGAGFFLALLISSLRYLARKNNWTKGNFQVITYVLAFFLTGLYGVANHTLRYLGSDVALTVVFIFWGIGGLITVMVGNFIPFWVMHISNNFFFDVKRLFDSDLARGGIILTLVLLTSLYVWLYIIRKRKKIITSEFV